jgi:tRNA-modifying protein YgfZ
MMADTENDSLLGSGRGFADLSFWRTVAVSGGDAFTWLNDLISADISDLTPGRARRALLLSPTGRVRAEFTVAIPDGILILIQDPSQPSPIDALLQPYTLSSDVVLEDRTTALALFAFPGRREVPDIPGTAHSAPSCLGVGVDLIAPEEDHDHLAAALATAFTLVGNEAIEEWRVMAGIPRCGVDALEEDLPQECGLEDAVSFDKGCYLGQEAVAKVRNLGHPRRLLLSLEAEEHVSPGDPVEVAGVLAGEVSSAAHRDGRAFVLARIRWEAREGPFRTSRGAELVPRR